MEEKIVIINRGVQTWMIVGRLYLPPNQPTEVDQETYQLLDGIEGIEIYEEIKKDEKVKRNDRRLTHEERSGLADSGNVSGIE